MNDLVITKFATDKGEAVVDFNSLANKEVVLDKLDTCISEQTIFNWIDVPSSEYTVHYNYYWSTSHSEVGPHSTWTYIVLPVEPGQKYKISSLAGQSARQWYQYAGTNMLLDSIIGMCSDASTASQREAEILIDSGVGTLVINHRTDGVLKIQREEFGGRGYVFDLEKSGVNKAIEDAVAGGGSNNSGTTSSVTTADNILAGKVLVTVGDSITQGADMNLAPETELGANPDYSNDTDAGRYKTYGWQIAKRNNMKFYNCGISGTTMQGVVNSGGTDKGDISKKNGFSKPGGRYTQLPDEIDFLTIFFGWNDTAYGTLGTINDTTAETYCGGFNVTLPYLIQKYPYTTIVLIVPFQTTANHRKAVRDLAKKWGVGCFDMMAEDEPFYWGKESSQNPAPNSTIAELRKRLHQINGAHPGYEGQYIISTRLENYLRRVGCYDRENAIMYKVSYNTPYGTAPATVNRVKVIYSTLLPTLTASGHTFQGWYTDSGFTKKATEGTILSADTTLYAKWS